VNYLIEAWIKNPKLFPNRISGTIAYSTERIDPNIRVPDFLLGDPLTKHQRELTCPRCIMLGESNSLYATRWKDGKTSYDEPRRLFCIQREVFSESYLPLSHRSSNSSPWPLDPQNYLILHTSTFCFVSQKWCNSWSFPIRIHSHPGGCKAYWYWTFSSTNVSRCFNNSYSYI
jgi:hypothetical protein